MQLREEFEVGRPPASVWAFFEQFERVAACVPGVEGLTQSGPDDIEVRITQSVGPMSATFAAAVTIVERVPEKLIAFTATGKTVRGAMGNVRAAVTVQVEAAGPDRTTVSVDGDVVLAGALGSVGQKVVAKQAGKVTAAFSRNLEAALGGAEVPAGRPAIGTAHLGDRASAPSAPSAVAPAPAARPGPDRWTLASVVLSAVSAVLSGIAVWQNRRSR
ncbi:CoxG family protein [Pseudonocardia sp. WMMC193]|uniref:CoxG family protein n=1 Tax=Pseudonocardia sp. WMMC193 TaxID=2911965 RepID=UPI001F38F7EB|nr:SRPBCC domain-containing protein [Pseudonocardia sp. WMMC193]MCF7547521.1 SRPBCC family protein [Pseudonocardia sp. WMMC193]